MSEKQPAKEKTGKEKTGSVFPVGPAGRRELRRELRNASNPKKTIEDFQNTHSLHAQMTKAFGTVPRTQYKATRSTRELETLDTDSVVTFLHHLGIPNHIFHKRISDTLLKSLEERIRTTQKSELLLELLKSCWVYATTIAELRPILFGVLRKLGPQTPLPVLLALAERDATNELKHSEIFQQLPLALKRLCWEADWDNRVSEGISDPQSFLQATRQTLLYETVQPHLESYLKNETLMDLANRAFVNTPSERKVLTTQRRALTKNASVFTTGKAIVHLRNLMGESSSSKAVSSNQRPKLMFAVLSILMARHGTATRPFLGVSDHLHCTLVADILLSTGGPLPKAYNNVLGLARTLDDIVQEGSISNENLLKLQNLLKLIYQPEHDGSSPKKPPPRPDSTVEIAPSAAVHRQLNRIVTSGIVALKEADPQQLFFLKVTDKVAPGYSRIIKHPMSISTMEEKVDESSYLSVDDWRSDVHLMFRNCQEYNKGPAGKWFRDEAKRQAKVFRDEIYPQAKRLYQNEIAKRKVVVEKTTGTNVRTDGPAISPLEPSSKKRKKEKEPYLPSMPALASMMLCDPFVVRIIVARVLREVRANILKSGCLPLSHETLPSLLQLLHIAYWSKDTCAIFGKKFFIPSSGVQEGEDPSGVLSYTALRQYLPLLVQLLLIAELERRVVQGGDLFEVSQSAFDLQMPKLEEDAWDNKEQLDVTVALVEGSLVHLCEPGQKNELSLASVFTKFSTALEALSKNVHEDRGFFVSLSKQLLRQKTRLPKDVRDAVVKCWCSWLKRKNTMFSPCHTTFIELLIVWSSFGNVLLPRDALMQFSQDVVKAVDEGESDKTRTFSELWKSNSDKFASIKKLYERVLKQLPDSSSLQWKEKMNVADSGTPMDIDSTTANQKEPAKDIKMTMKN